MLHHGRETPPRLDLESDALEGLLVQSAGGIWGAAHLLNCIHLLQIDGVEEFFEVSRDPGRGPRMQPSVLDRKSVQVENICPA